MGAIGGILGLAGGLGGAGQTNSGTNAGQLNAANQGSMNALSQQQGLLNALQGQQGIQDQSNVYNQLQGVVSGQGPNPAQAQLAQATGANVANQASLMAGQRGAGANVGLLARQNAMQGANLQQQAAGQGASMQAQQSLNALGQAAGQANTMAGQQIGATNAVTQAQQNYQNSLLGANTAAQGQQAGLAGQQMGSAGNLLGGALNGVGGVGGLLGGQKKAEGGLIASQPQGPQSMFGKSLMGQAQPMMADGGQVPAMVSPGEVYLSPEKVEPVAEGKANPMKVGEKIPGKPKVAGNSYANDVVPKKLDVGGVVIPNNIMQSKDPVRGAAEFVRAVMAKKGKKS